MTMLSWGSSVTTFNFVFRLITSAELMRARVILRVSLGLVLNFGLCSTWVSSLSSGFEVMIVNWFSIPFLKSSLGLPSVMMALTRTLVSRTTLGMGSSGGVSVFGYFLLDFVLGEFQFFLVHCFEDFVPFFFYVGEVEFFHDDGVAFAVD
jgi:hypothetical protein